MDETEFANPWTQRIDEPDVWYDRFTKYFVPLGITRNLLSAYIEYVKDTSPDKAVLMAVRRPISAPNDWTDMAGEWDWRKRALAYDANQVKDLSTVLQQARQEVQEATLEAVRTLRAALRNPKTAVPAAKEILDRGGLPAVTIHSIKMMPFTADDLAAARDELEQWMTDRPLLTSRNSPDSSG